MYVCKYELSERLKVKGAPSGTSHFVISFWTSVVHNSVSVRSVTCNKENVWYYLHFLVPLRGTEEKVLENIQNVMKM